MYGKGAESPMSTLSATAVWSRPRGPDRRSLVKNGRHIRDVDTEIQTRENTSTPVMERVGLKGSPQCPLDSLL